MLTFDILTIFPDMFNSAFSESIIKRGLDKKLFNINVHNLRKWSPDKRHQKIDDKPYGGGAGMLFMIEPIFNALQDLKKNNTYTVLLSANGNKFNQKKAGEFSNKEHIILICGHYEGVDQRVIDNLIDEEISIGEYVLTGGELPAMVVVDSTIRLISGVLGNENSILEESFSMDDDSLKEYPQYTRPASFNGWDVPEELTSGDHKKIEEWKNSMIKK